MRILGRLASTLGWTVLVALVLGATGLALRWAWVSVAPTAPDAPHLEQKRRYLSELPAVDPKRAPNVVVVLFDDLGYGDLSMHGNRLIETPRIDRAAAEGLRMDHFHSASPVCTPSRAALLTGRYPPRTRTDRHVFFPDASPVGRARRVLGWANELPADEITLAEVLGSAGYATGMVGKWHLGDRAGFRPRDFGFDSWFGVLFSNDMVPLDLYRDDEVIEADGRAPGRFGQGERDEQAPLGPGGIDQTRLTERYTEEAIAFIEANRERPFFLYLAHTFPHVPHYPSSEQAGRSRGGRYGDVVADLDRSTGAVLDTLARLGLAERTAIFITSDNGADYGGSPGALRGRKGEILDGGQRVPMILHWPGRVAAGRTSEQPAMNVDLFPTVLAWAGLPLPGDRVIDGVDLSPVLLEGGALPDRALYYYPVLDTLPGAVRVGAFKYLAQTGDVGRDRAHLTRTDLDNEAHDLGMLHPEVAGRLAARLDEMRDRVADNPRGWR